MAWILQCRTKSHNLAWDLLTADFRLLESLLETPDLVVTLFDTFEAGCFKSVYLLISSVDYHSVALEPLRFLYRSAHLRKALRIDWGMHQYLQESLVSPQISFWPLFILLCCNTGRDKSFFPIFNFDLFEVSELVLVSSVSHQLQDIFQLPIFSLGWVIFGFLSCHEVCEVEMLIRKALWWCR